MRNNNNYCVRVARDDLQITRCRKKVDEIKVSVVGLSQALGLLGNEVRMKIVYLLREEGRLCVCDLSEILEMKIPAISQHLRKLKDAKVLSSVREGVTIYYYVSPAMKSKLDTIFTLLPQGALV